MERPKFGEEDKFLRAQLSKGLYEKEVKNMSLKEKLKLVEQVLQNDKVFNTETDIEGGNPDRSDALKKKKFKLKLDSSDPISSLKKHLRRDLNEYISDETIKWTVINYPQIDEFIKNPQIIGYRAIIRFIFDEFIPSWSTEYQEGVKVILTNNTIKIDEYKMSAEGWAYLYLSLEQHDIEDEDSIKNPGWSSYLHGNTKKAKIESFILEHKLSTSYSALQALIYKCSKPYKDLKSLFIKYRALKDNQDIPKEEIERVSEQIRNQTQKMPALFKCIWYCNGRYPRIAHSIQEYFFSRL